ncbi:PLP-dependent aspartate aminotransferase family protein [Siphonobacter sp. SORGH_AS_1065]|uniref:trans-sulfuration enzyme family protein n=1 Tax=Siphonobacter sp. SORGH_AS_1065 TaxID=3041795 RepID=UPI00277D431C|nr:aminotransferase class V-fold PLP-dependent enzyme [Siphonobacter sp. SORGH_AS_1065]MDQ1086093.1 cystathionine gamma-synthase [Siphonobacter sp. SORGH_AS_1065]
MNLETLAIQVTRFHDANASAVTTPIYLSTTYERDSEGNLPKGFLYARGNNPNRDLLEKSIAVLEGGAVGFAFGSGMAAIAALFQALKPGDHVITTPFAYYAAQRLLVDVFEPWGLEFTLVDTSSIEEVEKAIRPNTKLFWLETPSNPLLHLTDVAALARLAHSVGAMCAVDNTWATPVLQNPIALGADVVMHSTTKYFGGHSDVLGGALVLAQEGELSLKLRQIQNLTGGIPSPFDCWLITRGIQTMPLRVKTQSASALPIAQWLEQHPAVERVYYPGLESHAQHELAVSQMKNGFGGMLSFEVKGGLPGAKKVAGALKVFTQATSLGGVESLIEPRKIYEGPDSPTPDGLLRVSVGLEHTQDLINDLEQALAQA